MRGVTLAARSRRYGAFESVRLTGFWAVGPFASVGVEASQYLAGEQITVSAHEPTVYGRVSTVSLKKGGYEAFGFRNEGK